MDRSLLEKIGRTLGAGGCASGSAAVRPGVSQGPVADAKCPITVRIPSDASSLQVALDDISTYLQHVCVTLLIESGYSISSAVCLHDGDFSNFRITSEDPVVTVSHCLPRVAIFLGVNAKMPTLACLINANGYGLDGIKLDASGMTVEKNCGIYNAYSTGLLAQNASSASVRGSNFTRAARNGATGAGITSWGAIVDATEADVSFSGYYGAQAAHGGILILEKGKANDCAMYGVRGSDRGSVDFSEGQASRCGVYGIYSFQNSHVNAPGSVVNDCGSANLVALNVSEINFRGGFAKGAKKNAPAGASSNYGHNVFLAGKSKIDLVNAVLTGAFDTGLYCDSSEASIGGVDVSGAGNRGLFSDDGSSISGKLAKADNCKVGAYVVNGGKLSSRQFSAVNCTDTAVVVDDGGEITLPFAMLTGAVLNGVKVLNGSRANIRNANCRRGAADDPADIQCFSGSVITATGSLGGLNRSANVVTAQGVIYK